MTMGNRRLLLVAAAVASLIGVGWFVRARTSAHQGARDRIGDRQVPVISARVQKRDVPLFLDGLGNVTAVRTVTVRSLVDGRLDQVLFREGQTVHAGDLLLKIDPRPFLNQLHQAEGALARDAAQLKDAQLNLERYRTLVDQKLIAQQQVDDQAALVGQLEGAVVVDRATIDAARLNLDYASIRSPIEGVTGVRLVDPGNVVHPSDPGGLVVLTQLDPIAVIFSLPQDDLTRVMQQHALSQLPVEAWSRDGAELLGTGRLQLIDNQINAATATMRLKAEFPNPHRLLWPNLFVKSRLLLTTRKEALVVPATVPQRGPEGTFAYVIQPDQTVQPRSIEVEITEGDLSVISRGLAEGDEVVAEGQGQLRAGSKVLPRPAGGGPRAPREGDAPKAATPKRSR